MEKNWILHALPKPTVPKLYRGVIVSIAGSGNEPWTDRLFNISLLGFNCDAYGYIYQFVSNLDEWENPRRKIPAAQLEFMRLTEKDYRFRKFSDEYINNLVNTADFVIMFNAYEKRRILEARFPVFKSKDFICLKNDIRWQTLRRVPNGAPILEYYAFLQGKKVTIRRPADEALLIAWLLTLENPMTKGQTEFWYERPSLLEEITNFTRSEFARIFVDGSTISARRVLGRDGFEWDPVTDVWHVDVPMDLRYQVIQRTRVLLYNSENYPIAWIPVRGPQTSRFGQPPYGRRSHIPTEEERLKAISSLPTSTLLHTSEDFAEVVPHSILVSHIYAQADEQPRPLDRGLEDLRF